VYAVQADGRVRVAAASVNPDHVAAVAERRIASCLEAEAAKVTRPASGRLLIEDLTRQSLDLLGSRDLARFAYGARAIMPWFPPALGSDDMLILYVLNAGEEPGLEFLLQWLGVLLPGWESAFQATIRKHDITANRLLSQVLPGESSLDELRKLHEDAISAMPWLSPASIARICEATTAYAEENGELADCESVREETSRLIRGLGDELEKRLDRGWPLDPGVKLNLCLLKWFLWRLEGRPDHSARALAEAATLSGKRMRDRLSSARRPLHLDRILPKFFVHELLGALSRSRLDLPPLGTESLALARKHLGRFISTILSDHPHTPDSIEAMTWVVAQYAYQVLGVDTRLHLASHMAHGARGESSLHMMKEFYRDHFFHSMEVCFLGHFLAYAQPRRGQRAFNLSPSLLRQWYVASLLHDIGYAVDVSSSLREWLGFFTSSAFETLNRGIGTALSAIGELEAFRLFARDYGIAQEHAPHEDHGVVGARHLAALGKDLRRQGGVHKLKDAIDAIATHNCQSAKTKYEKRAPLKALLILSDTLQAWRRPHFPHFSRAPAWMMATMMAHQQGDYAQSVTSASLLTNAEVRYPRDRPSVSFSPPLVLRLAFGSEVNRDSFVFNIWLDTICNLQRVDFANLPHEILVQILTPSFVPKSGGTPRRQIDRLIDAAAETHMAYLDGFLDRVNPMTAEIPDVMDVAQWRAKAAEPLSYYYAEARPPQGMQEMLSLSLRQLHRVSPLMQETMERFRKDLRRWKRFHEDRLALGDYSPWRHKGP